MRCRVGDGAIFNLEHCISPLLPSPASRRSKVERRNEPRPVASVNANTMTNHISDTFSFSEKGMAAGFELRTRRGKREKVENLVLRSRLKFVN